MPKLETSKVHDAYDQGSECPICTLMDAAEQTYLASFQGHRVMTPEVRVLTNRTGFCPEHTQRLYRGSNPLGLALMTQTYLAERLPDLRATLRAALAPSSRGAGRRGGGRFGALREALTDLRQSCHICDLLAADLDRYLFTVVYLWQHDPSFPPRLAASRGFCLGHLPPLLSKAEATLTGGDVQRFAQAVVSLVETRIDRLPGELAAFVSLFQTDATGVGTEEQRTALARTLQLLAGRLMRKE